MIIIKGRSNVSDIRYQNGEGCQCFFDIVVRTLCAIELANYVSAFGRCGYKVNKVSEHNQSGTTIFTPGLSFVRVWIVQRRS